MIALGNNIYRTLNDKFYLGTQQIGKVYKGTELIYPEKEIVIDGISIDTSVRKMNGNMYDLGINAYKNTCFEFCIIPDGIAGSVQFFGTHHDTWCSRSNCYLRASNGTKGEHPQSNWGNNNADDLYDEGTAFHYILGRTLNSFRYGGLHKTTNNRTAAASENQIAVPSGTSNKFFLSLRYKNSSNNTLKTGENYGLYYWESVRTSVIDAYAEYAGVTPVYPGESGYAAFLANLKSVPYYKNKIEECETNIYNIEHNTNAYPTVDIDKSLWNSNGKKSANLWLNSINRLNNSPFLNRNHGTVTDDSDITYYYDTSNSTLIYLIIWNESNENNQTTISNKFLYTSKEVTENNKKFVVIEKRSWNYSDKKFNPTVMETIYPFKMCVPSTN